MAVTPGRWRLIELRRTREAVRAGIDLLDRKREGLTRELAQRAGLAASRRARVQAALGRARRSLEHALVDIGRYAAEGAALAQPPASALSVTHDVVIGIRVPRIRAPSAPFRPSYGPVGTSWALDVAAGRFAAVLLIVMDLAAEETTVVRLRAALRRTTRTLNALEQVMLPELDAEIAAVSAGLDEDERDERIRRLRATRREAWPARGETTAR